MNKVISYSLFGAEKATPESGFSFDSYMRGFMVNVRVNRLLYPDWVTVLNTDTTTYNSKYKPIFDWLLKKRLILLYQFPANEPLCRAMLYRLAPAFEVNDGGGWKFTHVLCRDTDSICTHREVLAVKEWEQENKTIHCITDSISHNIPMMGGMIGVRPEYLSMRMKCQTFGDLMRMSNGINYEQKGADQTFLNRYVYPKCADSSTEHFMLGMVRNLAEGNGRHYEIPTNIKSGILERYKFIDTCAGHIGAAGYYEAPMVKFLNQIDDYREEYKEIENQYPSLFYWSSRV